MANKPNKVIYGNQVIIDLTQDTVEASKLLKGYTAHDRSGEIITGTSTFDADTSDADALASEIIKGKTAYVNGSKIEGTMIERGSQIDAISEKNQEISIKSGHHDGSGKVSIAATEQAKIVPENIANGITILGVIGTHTGEEGIDVQTKSATPYTDKAQTIVPDAVPGKTSYLSQVEVAKIKYVETPNAQGGITVEIGEKSPNI